MSKGEKMTLTKPTLVSLALALAGTTVLGGCVEKSRDLTRSERERLEQYVSEEPTDPEHELNVEFEDKIELVGYDVSAEQWRPGQPITVTWHWKVKRSLEDGWKLFTHVTDASNTNRVNADMEGVVRELYQPGAWKAGEYIKDQQQITLPGDWTDEQATLYVGLWNGPHRLRITDGPSDGENRARGLTIPTPVTAARNEPEAPTVPTMNVHPAGDITIDGELDEPAWRSAQPSRRFVNTMDGSRAEFGVTAKTLWDDENLYVAFVVDDEYLKSEFDDRDDHLWEQDAVEVMLDPGGDGRNYFEMQVSPKNVIFDTRYDSRRNPGPIGHADWNADIESAVKLDGEIDDDGGDEGYTVEMAIPWEAFATGEPPASKPNAGEVWRGNFYVMNATEDGSLAAAWSPPNVGDFHVPQRFGNLRFVDPSAQAAAAPAGGGATQMGAAVMAAVPLPAAVRRQLQRPSGGEVPQPAPGRRGVDEPQRGEPVPTPQNPNPGQ